MRYDNIIIIITINYCGMRFGNIIVVYNTWQRQKNMHTMIWAGIWGGGGGGIIIIQLATWLVLSESTLIICTHKYTSYH